MPVHTSADEVDARHIKGKRTARSLEQRIRDIQKRTRAVLGPPDPDFEFNKFRAELWGDDD